MFGNSPKDSRASNIASSGVLTAGKISTKNLYASADVTANRIVSQIGDISRIDCNIFAADTILTYANTNLNDTTLNGTTTLVNIPPNQTLGTNANSQIVALPGESKIVFYSNSFWTVPPGVNTITAICTGSGGDGGVGDPNVNGGGGGGGSCGFTTSTVIGVTPYDALQITIGDGTTPAKSTVRSNGIYVALADPGTSGTAGSNLAGGDGGPGIFGGGGGSVVTAGTQGLGGLTTGYNPLNSGINATDIAGGNGGGPNSVGGLGGVVVGGGGGGGGGGLGGGNGGNNSFPNGNNATGVGSGGGGSAGGFGATAAGTGGPGQVTLLYHTL